MLVLRFTIIVAVLQAGCGGDMCAFVPHPSSAHGAGGPYSSPLVSRSVCAAIPGTAALQLDHRRKVQRASALHSSSSGGIIVAAGDDDLEKVLSRIQTSGAAEAAEADLAWLHGVLQKEWELPLQGERVMFTTPRHYAGKLSSVLVQAGARPVWMPTVRYVPLPETNTMASQLDVALLDIASFDIVGFTSRYAMQGFWERMKTLYGGMVGALRALDDARVKFATTPALVRELRESLVSLKSDRILASDQGAADLSDVLGSTASGASVLCITPAFEELEDPKPLNQTLSKLSARGLDVTRAPAYLVCAGDPNFYKAELEGLMRGDIDVLGLTSSLEVQGLRHMLGDQLKEIPVSTSVIGNGKETALDAAALGLDMTVLGTKVASGEDFVFALADHCSSKRGLQIYLDH